MDPAPKKHLSDDALRRFFADAEPPPPAASTPLPATLGRYKILRHVADGATGAVYEAEDLQLGRRVAIKVLHAGCSEAFIRRFHREASLAANLKHPNIVTIHEISQARNEAGAALHFIVMDYYDRTLDPEGLPLRQRVEQLVSIADAVHHAHKNGVTHRDLKPANILLDREGRPVVSDFGLAREEAQVTQLTKSGTPVGTPSYMSPEQVAGDGAAVGPRSDVYALGVMLYQMATGSLPHGGDSVGGVYAAILTVEPPRPRSVAPDLDIELEAVCLKAMAKNPALRYADAGAFAADLRRYLADEPVLARSATVSYRLLRQVRKRPLAWTLGIVAILAIAVTVKFAWADRIQSRELAAAALADQISGAYLDLHLHGLTALQKLEDAYHEPGAAQNLDILLAEIDRVTAGVSKRFPDARIPQAWRGLAQFYAKRPDAIAALEAACADAGEDPFPHVLLARARLTEFTHLACIEAALGSDKHDVNLGHFAETPEMKGTRGKARAALVAATGRTMWKRLRHGAEYLVYAEAASRLGDERYGDAALQLEGLAGHAVLKAEAGCLRGVALCLAKRFDEGAAAWEGVLDRGWSTVALLAALARMDVAAGLKDAAAEYDKAIAHCARMIQEDPGWATPHLVAGLAWQRRGTGDWRKAIASLTAALDLDPELDEAWCARGVSRIEVDEIDGAIDDLTKALSIRPGYRDALIHRGEAYGRKGMLDRALQDYDAALGDPSREHRTRFNRAALFMDMAEQPGADLLGGYQRCIDEYGAAIRLKPDYDIAYSNRGNALMLRGNALADRRTDPTESYDRAMEDFGKALTLNPDLTETHMLRGIVHASRADWNEASGRDFTAHLDQAIAEYGKVIRAKPSFMRPYYLRGLTLGRKGHAEGARGADPRVSYQKSLEDLDAYLGANPNDAQVLGNTGELLLWFGRTAEAVERLDRALKIDPSLAHLAEMLKKARK